ncbi:amidotransferase [compost metagenome]
MLCFQGHPEFVPEYSRALLDARQDFLGEKVYKTGVASLEQGHQGATVAEWMMRFVAHKPQAPRAS